MKKKIFNKVIYALNNVNIISTKSVFVIGGFLRFFLLIYGHWHDSKSAFKYTDVDYMVFTGAAKEVYDGKSVYNRETYRYTPLLAWILIPNIMGVPYFGKIVFSICDMIAGYLIRNIMIWQGHSIRKANVYVTTWLWNPVVAVISTRGNSESMIGAGVLLCLWAALLKRPFLTGCLFGFIIHLKLYTIIYLFSFLWMMDNKYERKPMLKGVFSWITYSRFYFVLATLLSSVFLNGIMYKIYGMPFLEHTYFYHFIRTDYRHNFSPYHLWLYYASSPIKSSFHIPISFVSFIPQILLSMCLIPVVFSKKNLPVTIFSQTFAFVAFNKVCTSQYFMWYLILLPFFLPLLNVSTGLLMVFFWGFGQALWLFFAYCLEFLGINVFFPYLWLSGLLFFVINIWILGYIIDCLSHKII
ncbi:hypothetical protein PNEG_01458 [Pneumocystis murina B123]|uniref:GPI mannosyltransferase 1 n=1 Tax=Pneumocystis murina (strain B123) TaxID=1069680 RepID=M7PI96_PNEMU|nr:hypothetical protein PNEG_01458 [Pneumocystis murina B123]EMR10184.1 hypothetical protein PNEG_01458 [Pneumocystis murina B123]